MLRPLEFQDEHTIYIDLSPVKLIFLHICFHFNSILGRFVIMHFLVNKFLQLTIEQAACNSQRKEDHWLFGSCVYVVVCAVAVSLVLEN